MNPANQATISRIVTEHGITQVAIETAFEEGKLVGAMAAAQAIASGQLTNSNAAFAGASNNDDEDDKPSAMSTSDVAALTRLGINVKKSFRMRSSVFTVVGYRPSRWKFPIVCATQNGTRYKFTVAQVLAYQK